MKIPASLSDDEGHDSLAGEDPAADDPRDGDRGEASHSAVRSSSSCSSQSQSTLDEWASAGGGATAPADGSPSAPSDGDAEPVRQLAEANAEQIDTLTDTLNWLAGVVADRTDSPGEAPAGDTGETPNRGFQ